MLKVSDFSTILKTDANSNNDEESEISSTRASGFIDSCATHVISMDRSDFEWINTTPTVKMNAADGEVAGGAPVAYVGTWKQNNLGIKAALFFDRLPKVVGRIISTTILRSLGWDVHFLSGRQSFMHRSISDEKIPIVHLSSSGLPCANFDFNKPSDVRMHWTEGLGGQLDEEKGGLVLLSQLEKHRRVGHLSIPGQKLRQKCEECDLAKGAKSSFSKERHDKYKKNEPLQQLNCDFYGPLTPESIRGYKLILVFICDAISFVWAEPVRHRSECVEIVKKLIEKVRAEDGKDLHEKVVHIIRSDNDPVFRSTSWNDTLRALGVTVTHSVPYCPQQNGVVERFMKTIGLNLRAILLYVDGRLWRYAIVYLCMSWNAIARNYPRAPTYDGKTPTEARKLRGVDEKDFGTTLQGVGSNPQHQRRFGCLAYVMIQPREEVKKLQPKYRKMVFLGYSSANNSAWLFGGYFDDNRCKSGIRWHEVESRDAKFYEQILVSDLEQLKPTKDAAVLDEKLLESLRDPIVRGGPVIQSGQSGVPEPYVLRCPDEATADGSVEKRDEGSCLIC